MTSNDSNRNQENKSNYKKNNQAKWRKFYLDEIYTSPMALYDFIAMKNDLLRRNGKSTVSRSKNVNVVLWVIARHLPTVTSEGKETNLKDISASTWMSLDYIADQAGISKSRVSESIRYLKDEGIIIETIDDRKGHNERYRAFSEYAIKVIVENTNRQFARYGKRNWRLRKAELTVTESVTNRVMDGVKDKVSNNGDNHSDVLSVEKISTRWALVENQSKEGKFVYMPNESKLKTFLQELKFLNRESEEKRKAKEDPVIDGKIENAGRGSPPAPDYPPRDFKLGHSAKYSTGANGLKSLVFDIVKGKLWVSLKEGELDELSERIYELERSHGDLFFEYLKIASDYSDKSKKEGGNRTTLRDALFDDTNIKLVTEALWKKRQTEK